MEVVIKNCNNIDAGKIEIKENKLNIKYAINGTGKSSISMALRAWLNDNMNGTKELKKFAPFKHIGDDSIITDVQVSGVINSLKIFDEKYINEFVFRPDELLKGSFDVFIKDENYEKGIAEIEEKVKQIRKMFTDHQEIQDLINDFNAISNSFGKQVKAGIHGASSLAKSFKDGNKVENIPEGLDSFKDFIRCEDNYKWVKWQHDGRIFVERSEKCPCCTNSIPDLKEKILRVSSVYDPKSIENLNMIVAAFSRLSKYFSDSTITKINEFVKNVNGYTPDQAAYLLEVKDQIERLSEKFRRTQNLGFFTLKDIDKVIEGLREYEIDTSLFTHLNSTTTKEKADIVNDAIKNVLESAGELQGAINKQKRYIERLVDENQKGINGFLESAGYKYYDLSRRE